MSDDAVLLREDDGLLLITINRPEVRNAVNADVARGIGQALERLDGTAELLGAVLTGAGSSFCTGMDLGGFRKGARPSYGDRGFAGITRRPPEKPIVAAVEGYALAGGFEIAICCDLIVAAEDAGFGLPEVRRGLIAKAGGLLRLPQRLPYHVVAELVMTGAPQSAQRMHSLGVVNRLAPPGEALSVAVALAREVVANAPLALAATKEILVAQRDWTSEEMWDLQEAIAVKAIASDDAREGAAAFKEKRTPRWQGR